jgi:hypothetical protein
VDKYYFESDDYSNCLEPCPVIGNGMMIGSCSCLECPNNEGYEEEIWIKCSKLIEKKQERRED